MKPIRRSILRHKNNMAGKKRLPDWVEEVQDFFDELPSAPRKMKYWILERYTKQTLKIETLQGGFQEYNRLLLHAMFQVLVNYVEHDVPSVANEHDPKSPFYPLRGKSKAEIGIAYLEYYKPDPEEFMHSKMEENHARDMEYVALYRWWKDVYPNRKESIDLLSEGELDSFSPYEHMPADARGMIEMRSRTEDPRYQTWREACDASHKLDEQYEQEDTEMMIRLIKARRGMWN